MRPALALDVENVNQCWQYILPASGDIEPRMCQASTGLGPPLHLASADLLLVASAASASSIHPEYATPVLPFILDVHCQGWVDITEIIGRHG